MERLSRQITFASVYWLYHVIGLYLYRLFFIILPISALVTGTDQSVLVVFILSVAAIPLAFSIRVHCWAKENLNSSALSRKFEMNLSLWNSGGMQCYFIIVLKLSEKYSKSLKACTGMHQFFKNQWVTLLLKIFSCR